jgi:hypothetical protein
MDSFPKTIEEKVNLFETDLENNIKTEDRDVFEFVKFFLHTINIIDNKIILSELEDDNKSYFSIEDLSKINKICLSVEKNESNHFVRLVFESNNKKYFLKGQNFDNHKSQCLKYIKNIMYIINLFEELLLHNNFNNNQKQKVL